MTRKRIHLSGFSFLLFLAATVSQGAAPNSLNYLESFESWSVGSNLLDNPYWAGSALTSQVVNASGSYEQNWTNTYPYPRTNTLFPIQGVTHAKVVSFTNAQMQYAIAPYFSYTNTILDFMMNPAASETPGESTLANAQTAFFVDTNGHLNAWYRPTLGSTNWATFSSSSVTDWSRVSVLFKYYVPVGGSNFFKVVLNGVDQVPDSGGFNNAGDTFTAAPGGVWMLAVTQTNKVTAFGFSGNGGLDDLVVTTNASVNYYAFNITAVAGPEGTISPAQTNAYSGASQVFVIARTNNHFRIADITTNGISVGSGSFNNETVSTNWTWLNIRGTGVVQVTFSPRWFTLVGSAGANGTVSPASTNAWAGSNQSFTVSANSNFRISDIKTNGTSVGSFANDNVSTNWVWPTVEGTGIVQATFTERKCMLVASNGAFGTNFLFGSSGAQSTNANAGQNITFTIRTNTPGYQIADIQTNGYSIGALGNGVLNTNWTWQNVQSTGLVLATFTERKYLMVGNAGANGTVTPTSTNVNVSSNLVFTIAADSNYRISSIATNGTVLGWTYNNNSTTTNFTWLNIQNTGLVYATFTPRTFNLTASAGANGSVLPTSTNVNAGASPVFAIAATTTGYRILQIVTSNSLGMSTNSSFDNVSRNYNFTWSNIQADGSLSVSFTNQIIRGSVYKML